MQLFKPADWKELYRDNTVDTMTQDYMVKGYSKEFGATEQEKRWLLEYTHSNLWKAYVDSDIKGDKEMTELCGRDYSGVTVSTAGIVWDQTYERCAELKKRMGAVREIEESWISHANKSGDALAAAKEVVRRAIALLPAEASEPKEYEGMILAGIEDAANAKNKGAVLSANPGISVEEEAKLQYGKGDKSSAYRAMGNTMYTQMPEELKQGELTAQLAARAITGIRETAAGFYLLMNRPLTAQLPGGDGGNGNDKPKAEVDKATGTIKCKGCYVKHEDATVVLFDDNGKEVERVYSSTFHRNPRIPIGLDKKVLRKLGAKDQREVDDKKLAAKYNAEMRKLIKSTPLPNKRLRFYDEKHNVKKEVILETKVVHSTKVYNADWNEFREHRDVLTRHGEASVDGSHAIVVESHDEIRGTTTNNYKLEYYDAAGNVLWSKKFPKNKIISAFAISEDGKKVATIDTCVECDHMSPEGLQSLLGFALYNEKGEEILHFPNGPKGEGYSPHSQIIMSPSGKYISVETSDENHNNIPVFIDAEEKSFYIYNNSQASVPEIPNDGIVAISFWGPETKTIDLKTVKFEALQ